MVDVAVLGLLRSVAITRHAGAASKRTLHARDVEVGGVLLYTMLRAPRADSREAAFSSETAWREPRPADTASIGADESSAIPRPEPFRECLSELGARQWPPYAVS